MAGEDEAERRILSDTAGQLAKILLMESVTEDVAVEPWDPTKRRVGPDEQFDMLTQMLQAHADDCRSLGADIPLLIGVADSFAEQMQAHMKDLHYGGLRPDQIHLLIEAEVPDSTLINNLS